MGHSKHVYLVKLVACVVMLLHGLINYHFGNFIQLDDNFRKDIASLHNGNFLNYISPLSLQVLFVILGITLYILFHLEDTPQTTPFLHLLTNAQ